MTPIGAECLPVSVTVEGDLDLVPTVLEQLEFDIDFSGLLRSSEEGVATLCVEVSGGLDGTSITARAEADGEELLRKTYSSSSDDVYPLVHALADDLVFCLTGEQGIASTRIAFVSRVGETYRLVAGSLDPRSPVLLIEDEQVITTPAWSPDGARIAFTSFRSDNADLYVYSIGQRSARKVSSLPGLNATPAWSPDGTMLALTVSEGSDPNICLLDLATGGLQKLTTRSSIETSPSFSPSGLQLVFTSDRLGAPQLFVMDNTGAAVRRFNYAHAYCDSPSWSPTGDRIAYAARTSSGSIHVFVADADGSNVRQVTFEGYLNEDPSWSPTGRHLVFSSNRGGERSIYVLELNDLLLRELPGPGECYCPTWSPL
ncbi:PD40 domain-containing protein [Candidatus Fermentibacterales bacterium]|nr:PD40 domain-containing protein [Candidatus Fermentibacterales bacterium]